jgi:integrase
MTKRGERAGIEDRWHRPARRGEDVRYPADAGPGDAVWCVDGKHGTTATMVCTRRHGIGYRWQARWVGDGQERSKSFARKVDAQAHVTQVTAELHTGAYVDARRSATTFGTVAEEWFSAKRPKLKPSTAGGYRSLLDMTLLPRWRDVTLADLTHADVQSWVTWMVTSPAARQPRTTDAGRNAKREPLSPRRAVQAYGVLKQILAFAIRTKRLATNPADDIELPRVVHRGETALTHQQVGALVSAAGDAGPMLLTLAYTGLRFGELAALRVADVDLTRRRILVDKAVAQVIGEGLTEGTTKTHQARSVPILTTELAEVLTEVTKDRKGTEHLFPAPDGGPMRNSYLRWRFDQARDGAGLTGISIKTLRHTAGSLALASGASVVTVQRLLGHQDATTTLRVYSHMLPDDFDSLSVAMESASRKATNVLFVDDS